MADIATLGIKVDTKGVEKGSTKLQELSKASKIATVAITALLTASITLGKRFIDNADQIGKTASKLGIATDELQKLRFGAEKAGVAQTALDMGMQRFSRRVAEAVTGNGELVGVLEQYNIAVKNADGSTRSTKDILNDYADAIKNTKDEKERLRIAFKGFDSEGVALVNMLKDGADGLNKFRDRADELGIVLSDSVIKKSEEANDTISELGKIITVNFQQGMLDGFLDDFNDLSDLMTDPALAQSFRDLGELGGDLVGTFLKIAGAIGSTYGELKRLVTTFTSFEAMQQRSIDKLLKENELIQKSIDGRNLEIKVRGEVVSKMQAEAEMRANSGKIKQLGTEIELIRKLNKEEEANAVSSTVNVNVTNKALEDYLKTLQDIKDAKEKSKKNDKDANSNWLEAQALIKGAWTEQERYNAELMRLNELRAMNLVSDEEYIKILKQMDDELKNASTSMEDILGNAINNNIESFEDLKDVGISVLQDLATEWIKNSEIFKSGGKASSGGGIIDSLIGGAGSILGGFFGGGKAVGGSVNANQVYEVGENGRELFIPSGSGRIETAERTASAMNGGKTENLVVNQVINLSAGVPEAVQQAMEQAMPFIKAEAVAGVQEARARGAT